MENRKSAAWLHLSNELIKKNREFTEALKNKKPHSELKVIFEGITEIYTEIQEYKNGQLVA